MYVCIALDWRCRECVVSYITKTAGGDLNCIYKKHTPAYQLLSLSSACHDS